MQVHPNIQLIAGRYRLGLANGEDLVGVADALLEGGQSDDAVIELASLSNPIMSEAGPLFENMCSKLSVVIPNSADAISMVLHESMLTIVSDQSATRRELTHLVRNIYYPILSKEHSTKYVGDSRGLENLIGAYWMYDEVHERPNEVSFQGKYGQEALLLLDKHVRQLANEWLQRHVSRS